MIIFSGRRVVHLPGGLKFLYKRIKKLLLFERQNVTISAPPRRHGAAGAGITDMINNTPTTKAVLTVLMIVWYILEIVKSVIELLR